MAVFFAIPGDLSSPTGGYQYARRLLAALPQLQHLPLPDGFPHPSHAALTEASRLLTTVPPGAPMLVDGLALGALPEHCLDTVRARIIALVHHPLCLESGLSDQSARALRISEQAALSRAAHVVVTSASTAALLTQEFGVPSVRLTIAEPGTDPSPRAPATGTPPRLLAVGAVTPRKGYDQLVRALAELKHLAWHLTVAGALDRDRATEGSLRTAIVAHGMSQRIILAGAVDPTDLQGLYHSTDVFVTTSLHEGYGMAAAEAMAHGLPLVASTGGALAATIPDAAALKYPAGDTAQLRQALHRMLTDIACRTACANASWSAGQQLPSWDQTASRIAAALASVAHSSAEH